MQSMFSQGNVVILQSKASKKSLRINNGDVEGNGGRGELAQFRVHVKRPGVVSLQNVHESYNWLAIFQEQTIGTVRYKAHTVTHTGVCSNTPVKVLSVTCSLYMEYLHTTSLLCVEHCQECMNIGIVHRNAQCQHFVRVLQRFCKLQLHKS